MDIKNVKQEKKILERKIINLIAAYEANTNTEVCDISISRYSCGGFISVIELSANVKL